MGSWSAGNIPEDLWREILSRLPVKSLLRFRCVSRSWRSLIADPDFCRSHLHSCENNRHRTHLIFAQVVVGRPDRVVKCSSTMETVEVLASIWNLTNQKMTTFHTSNYPGYWVIVSFINGLCLLRECYSEGLMLWNPSIRKLRSVPPSPKVSHGMGNFNLGIGFDPLAKDYKVVTLVGQFQDNSVHSVAVYSVMTDSWKVIRFPGGRCPDWHWSFSRYLGPYGLKTVSYWGHMCFIAKNVDTDIDDLVSFDLSKEVFTSTRLPEDCLIRHCQELVVVNGECRWVNYDFWRGKGSIWVLEGCGSDFVSMCWKQRCSFSIQIPTSFVNILTNGDLLLRRDKGVMRYNVETLEKKMLVDEHGDTINILDVYQYNESLILLQ